MSSKKNRKPDPEFALFPDRPPAAEAGVNREPQTLVALYLDRTCSQQVGWEATVRGVSSLIGRCRAHPAARSSVRVSVALCGPEVSVTPFAPFAETTLPDVPLVGGSPGSSWILDLTRRFPSERTRLTNAGVPVNKALGLLLSDFWFDDPDAFDAAVEAYRALENSWANFTGFLVMTGPNPNRNLAGRISTKRTPVHLDELKVDELFCWLSEAVIRASVSRPGQSVELPTPAWTLTDDVRR